MVADAAIYQPWRLFQWWHAYDAYAPEVCRRDGLIAATGSLAATGASMALSVIRARAAKQTTTYGSSRWATPREIKRMGLLNHAGFFLGLSRGNQVGMCATINLTRDHAAPRS